MLLVALLFLYSVNYGSANSWVMNWSAPDHFFFFFNVCVSACFVWFSYMKNRIRMFFSFSLQEKKDIISSLWLPSESWSYWIVVPSWKTFFFDSGVSDSAFTLWWILVWSTICIYTSVAAYGRAETQTSCIFHFSLVLMGEVNENCIVHGTTFLEFPQTVGFSTACGQKKCLSWKFLSWSWYTLQSFFGTCEECF